MTETVELFYQAIRFTPVWLIVDFVLIAHLFISWYFSAKKTAWKIDFWFLTLLMGVFQSLLVMYPFNASIYNAKSTLNDQLQIASFVDQAFAISVLGYVGIWIGRYSFNIKQIRSCITPVLEIALPLLKIVERNGKNRNATLILAWAAILCGAVIVLIPFASGSFFNARGYYLGLPALRPLFNITFSLFPIALTFLALRSVQFKDKSCLYLACTLMGISLFFGVRAVFIGGLLSFLTFKAFYAQGRISLLKLGSICFSFFVLAIFLLNLREEAQNPFNIFGTLLYKYFYGNNFSDTRDFAWILSYWDGEYLYGKTYVAGILSFIPRALSSFREEWGISMVTNAMVGFDSDLMPGLRPGLFGEAYFNFGLLGVILFGCLFGFTLRYVDVKIKEAVAASRDIIKGYAYTFVFAIVSCFSITAGFWGLYIFAFVNLVLPLFSKRRSSFHSDEIRSKL
jgi:oligosaccharide repeat unit polymerase